MLNIKKKRNRCKTPTTIIIYRSHQKTPSPKFIEMVINSGGGNKGKHVGRKFVNGGSGGTKAVRVAQDAGEMYATVSKMLGNCMCGVMCYDGKNRLCIIRKKFTGRRKTDNIVSAGGLILVGVHDYSGSSSSSSSSSSGSSAVSRPLQRCDLLYVYNDQEREKLRKVCDFGKLSAAPGAAAAPAGKADDDDNIKFITSGTGIFNKYANRDTRAAGDGVSAASAASVSEITDTGTIGGVDWLKDMYPESDEEEDEEEEEEGEKEEEGEEDEEEDEDEDEDEEEEEEQRRKQKKHVVHRGTRADTINVDDI
jgi:translation initiation factor IF-1